MKRNNYRRLLSLIGVIIICFSMVSAFTVSASAASWKTGKFDMNYSRKGYTNIYLTNLKKDAKITVYAYTSVNKLFSKKQKESKEKFHFTLTDNRGKILYETDTYSGTTFKLGKDHNSYRVYLSWSRKVSESINWVCTDSWAIKAKTNCRF